MVNFSFSLVCGSQWCRVFYVGCIQVYSCVLSSDSGLSLECAGIFGGQAQKKPALLRS